MALNRYREVIKNQKPFNYAKSMFGVEELADVSGPYDLAKTTIMRALAAAIEDRNPRFSPLLGVRGSGKTHFYFHLRNIEKKEDPSWMVVYIPPPEKNAIENVPFHIYYYTISQKGDLLLNQAAEKIMQEYMRGGILRKPSTEELLRYILRDYPGIAADIVKSIFIYGHDKTKKDIAKKWLFGEKLTDDEVSTLGVARHSLRAEDQVFSAFNILCKYTERVLILFLDDLHSVYMEQGADAAGAYLEHIKRFYNELQNITFIGTCLTDKWDAVLQTLDDAMMTRLFPEVEIEDFSLSDLQNFYLQTMEHIWSKQGLPPPEDQYYPLSEVIIRQVFQKSRGNPHNASKILKEKFSTIS